MSKVLNTRPMSACATVTVDFIRYHYESCESCVVIHYCEDVIYTAYFPVIPTWTYTRLNLLMFVGTVVRRVRGLWVVLVDCRPFSGVDMLGTPCTIFVHPG